jgi:hypothetical protein
MKSKMFGGFFVFALTFSLMSPAHAVGFRDREVLNRLSGNAGTLIETHNVADVGPTFINSASSDGPAQVDIPFDSSNIQILARTDGRTGDLAGFQDKKPLQMTKWSASGSMKVVAEQSKDSQKDLGKNEKWSGRLVYNASPNDFPVNELVEFRLNHKYNATVPALIIRRLPYTYRQLLQIQAGAQQGVLPEDANIGGAVEAGVGNSVTPRKVGSAAKAPNGPPADDDEGDFDPVAYQKARGNQRPDAARKRDIEDDDDRDRQPRRDSETRRPAPKQRRTDEDDEDDRGPRGRESDPRDNHGDGKLAPKRMMPAAGKVMIELVDSAGEEIQLQQPLEIDLRVNGRLFKTITITGGWVGQVPAGMFDIELFESDAAQFKIARFSVERVLAGYVGTLTLRLKEKK